MFLCVGQKPWHLWSTIRGGSDAPTWSRFRLTLAAIKQWTFKSFDAVVHKECSSCAPVFDVIVTTPK